MAFKCNVCGRSFETEHGRHVHVSRAHKTRKPRLPGTDLPDGPPMRPAKAAAPPKEKVAEDHGLWTGGQVRLIDNLVAMQAAELRGVAQIIDVLLRQRAADVAS